MGLCLLIATLVAILATPSQCYKGTLIQRFGQLMQHSQTLVEADIVAPNEKVYSTAANLYIQYFGFQNGKFGIADSYWFQHCKLSA